mmetsp:Transcript_31681/g.57708  ORF Transcript_31681/g.57708 Transcript_31681/m.57708 type:complete len:186 (+) Transcript_31681:820-1377(+)
MLKQAPDNMVTIRMAGDVEHLVYNDICEMLYLLAWAVLDEALQDAATVFVTSSLNEEAFALESFDDELIMARPQPRYQFLHDVVGMRAPHSIPNVAAELLRHGEQIVLFGFIHECLNFSAALGATGEFPNPASHAAALGHDHLLIRAGLTHGFRLADCFHDLGPCPIGLKTAWQVGLPRVSLPLP